MAESQISGRVLAWALSVAVVAAGGVALQLARDALTDGLERLPDLARWTAAEPAPPPPAPPPAPAPPAAPASPRLTRAEVTAALEPLPLRVLELVGEGRGELLDFADIGSRDAGKAERARRFFANWGRTWHNRLDQLEGAIPPAEECERFADLRPACGLVTEAVCILRQVPDVERVVDAQGRLDVVERIVEHFLAPPEEPPAPG